MNLFLVKISTQSYYGRHARGCHTNHLMNSFKEVLTADHRMNKNLSVSIGKEVLSWLKVVTICLPHLILHIIVITAMIAV